MKFTTDESKFEFTENVEARTITLITHEAHTVFYFPKDYDKDTFLNTYDFFLDFSVSKMPRAMTEISSSIKGSRIFTELKPGVVHDGRHKPEFFINRKGKKVNRDRWSDGMTWEEWCLEEQAAKEVHRRPKKTKSFHIEDDEKPILDDDWKAPERKSIFQPTKKKEIDSDSNLGDILGDLFDK